VSQRVDRVAEEIRVELSDLFLREVRDPRVHLASVSRVEVSRDLGHARIWVSVLGSEKEQTEAMEGLERARGFLRSQLAHRLNLRVTPVIKFELDRGAQRLQEMTALLDSLHPADADTDGKKGERDDS
jgi:ribosome-binding factor A